MNALKRDTDREIEEMYRKSNLFKGVDEATLDDLIAAVRFQVENLDHPFIRNQEKVLLRERLKDLMVSLKIARLRLEPKVF